MTGKDGALDWAAVEARLTTAIEQLGAALRGAQPLVRSVLQRSVNNVKPIHLIAAFWLGDDPGNGVVLSIMVTRADGPFEVHGDVMREDGPTISELPALELGVRPTPKDVEASILTVRTFILQSSDVIAAALSAASDAAIT